MPEGVGQFQALRFPEDLGTSKVPGYITFTPQQVQYGGVSGKSEYGNGVGTPNATGYSGDAARGAGIQPSGDGIVDNIKSETEKAFSPITSRVNSFANSVSTQGFFKSLDLGGALKKIAGTIDIGDGALTFGVETQPDRIFSTGSISMFLPPELVSENGATYNQAELGGAVAAGLKELQSQGSSIDGKAGLGRVLKAVTGGALSDLAGQGKLGEINALTSGKVRNPYSYQIFAGTAHRKFDYTFKCVPKNADEARAISDITDMFQYWMLPGRDLSSDLQFFEIPAQWQIGYYKYDGGLLDHYQQPNACFLQSCNISYGGDAGSQLHADGSPIVTQINLSFIEIEPLYRQVSKMSRSDNRNNKR